MDNSIVRIIDINVNEIMPNRFQPRRQFDEDEIMELSDSIKKYGVIQPLVVRTIGDKYEIIAGERRYKAAVLAGLETVPVIVRNLPDKDSAEIAIIENIQRRNLSAIEEALSYKKILDMGYLTQEDLALKLGKSQPTIANKIRLLNLSDEVQEALLDNKISERHARSLLKLLTSKEQNEMLDRIINERLTVRKTDEEIEKIKRIERGEEKMNDDNLNNQVPPMETLSVSESINKMPEVPSQPEVASQPTFTMPEVPSQPEVASQPAFTMPEVPSQPEVAPQPTFTMPEVPSQPEVAPQPAFTMPEVPSQPEVAPQPTFTMPEVPSQDINSLNISSVGDTTPIIPQVTAPVTSPIIEQPEISVQQGPEQSQIVQPSIQEQSQPETIGEQAVTGPIIITDYNKQYDPIMPEQSQPVQKTEFKSVIDAIRECSAKIEKFGYVIDVEEYDLANLYQVVFKVEK